MSWREVGRRDYASVVRFLSADEPRHVPFTARMRTGARGCRVWARGTGDGIAECILVTNAGLVLPVLDAGLGDRAGLASILTGAAAPVRSVMGPRRCVAGVVELLPVEPGARIDYFLMTLGRGTLRPALPPDMPGLRVRRADPFDAEALFPLQKGYELEEVVIDPSHFSEAGCMRLLRSALRDELVFVAERDGVPLAKAATNARGFAVDQVGGVYTAPAERGKRLAAAVVSGLLEEVFREKSAACLFVKKHNLPAIALYDRLGFVPVTDYCIAYYGL